MKIGLIYGSTTGNTEAAAKQIAERLASYGNIIMGEVSGVDFSHFSDCSLILLGTSTWGMGELQEDWEGKEALKGLELQGKAVALFGTGDQVAFDETFVDALGVLADAVLAAGGRLIGRWPIAGYDFANSAAVREGLFVGLALDEDNQPEQTETRIAVWTAQLKEEI